MKIIDQVHLIKQKFIKSPIKTIGKDGHVALVNTKQFVKVIIFIL